MGDPISENDAVLKAAEKFGDVRSLDLERAAEGGAMVLSIPAGRTVVSIKKYLDEYLEKPERRIGTAALATVKSFVEHVNRHKDNNSAIFADVTDTAARILCIYDYNPAGPAGGARFGHHRALYDCPFSDEWKIWTAKRGQMSQEDFARLLEDRIMDVIVPEQALGGIQAFVEKMATTLATPQKLISLSRGLTINVGQKVTKTVSLSTGEGIVSFEEKHAGEGGEDLKVPGAFVVAIPVFKGAEVLDQLAIRLRYRHSNGLITWSLEPHALERVRDNAIKCAAEQIAKETELPVFFGRPES